MRRALLVLVLVLGAYVGAAAWAGARTPGGSTVEGVAVGGLDAAAARQRLQAELVPRAAQPITLTAGTGRAQLMAGQAGLGVDAAATIEQLTGFTLDPRSLVQHLLGAGAIAAVTTRDDERLTTAVEVAAKSLDQPLVEGEVTFSAEGAVLRAGQPGRTLDQAATADLVADRWLRVESLEVPAAVQEPKVKPELLQRVYDDFARPATSAPLTVVVGDRNIVVPVSGFGPTLSVAIEGQTPTPTVDGAALEQVIRSIDPRVEREPVEATIVLRGGTPSVVAGSPGQRVEPAGLAAAVLPALTSPERTARVSAEVVQPKLTTAKAQALGVDEQVSTFTTRFGPNPPRVTNIRIAARTLDGILVQPGQVFSLNEALGPRTPDKGYRQAPVIDRGRLTKGYGGGVSQVSTTLFNAVFFAGLDTITHKPHSFYISRYPEGREATVSFPTVDQKFRNDSGKGILISTEVTSRSITVSFYGTKVWDIEATKGPRTNPREPKTIRDSGSDCVSQSPQAGFDVTVGRVFSRGGERVRTERFYTRYIAEDAVICS